MSSRVNELMSERVNDFEIECKDTTKNVLLEGQTKKVTSRDITFAGFGGLLLEMISSVMFGLVIHPLAQ